MVGCLYGVLVVKKYNGRTYYELDLYERCIYCTFNTTVFVYVIVVEMEYSN